ncbi:S-layer homology domain-containing protein [Neglectibacter timonensis]|uniref:S-layer homology domain-containing protein n=4 Tax=Neglectibacter timonensis TaxID=1776382 RepID=A0ABT1S3K5_9FIRM|nr:S-layer homology domain-containing protein [Neglectibacter timonensis]MCQ4841514.1 S-layer homology domain-containing protein [Neglectibacter timonensis]MCQ4844806.1 S-layer homology domain-containing protein [Neglectibacter timonensis]
MKKSKFLKKSLATLLALMLVVAMIPVGAAAATLPDITRITVDGAVVELDADGTTFAADIAADASSVEIGADFAGDTSSFVMTQKDGVNKNTVSNGVTADLALNKYPDAVSGVITIPMVLTSADGAATKTYKLVLTQTTKGTTTNLKSVTAGDKVIDATFDNDTKVISVTVPRGYTSGGTIALETEDNAVIDAGDKTAVSIDDGFIVTSESTGNAASWTFAKTEVDAITSFEIDGVSGVFSKSSGAEFNDTITVTLPAEKFVDADGNPITNPKFPVTFSTLGNTVVSENTLSTLENGKTYTFANLGTTDLENGQLTVNCKGVSQVYTLKVIKAKAGDKDITYAEIDSEIATISGNKISVEVPAAATLTDLPVIFRTATSVAAITLSGGSTTSAMTIVKDGAATSEYQQWKGSNSDSSNDNKINLTKPVAVTVKAADGSLKQYTLTVTKASEVNEAKASAMWLKDGETQYEGKISGNNVTFKVPYMTKSDDFKGWNVYITPSSNAKAYQGDGTTAIVNGTKVFGTIMTGVNIDTAEKTVKTVKDNAFCIVNKADPTVKSVYSVTIEFEDAKSGSTLTDLTVTSTQKTNDVDAFKAITADNTFKAKVDGSAKTVTINPAFTLSNYTHLVTSFTTAAGGVAFYAEADSDDYNNVTPVAALTKDSDNEAAIDSTKFVADKYIIVLPEIIAKDITSAITKDQAKLGTVYKMAVVAAAKVKDSTLKTLTINDVKLTISGNKITGTIPYGMTVDAEGKIVDATAFFANFTAGKYATVTSKETSSNKFVNAGGAIGDGDPEAVSADNAKIAFVRGNDNKVAVYSLKGAVNADNTAAMTAFKVTAEDPASSSEYVFDLKYADPNSEAAITSFKLAGVTGTISGKTISVTVPYNTKLNGLIPTFTTSTGAEVKLATNTVLSGKTAIDFSKDVKLTVTSEDKANTVIYTVKVKVSEQFSDVKQGDWFYNEVMTAAANGWVDGTGNGKFSPYEGMKRGDFAKIVAAIDNADLSKYTDSAFPDVPSDKYYSAAVAYCADKGYIGGDEKGYFNGEKMITREEAAKIMCNVKGLTPVTEPTTKFADDAKISNWAKGYVYACKEAKIFGGDEKNCFNASSTMQRCEGAAILVRAFA